jgi:hypothetical protein
MRSGLVQWLIAAVGMAAGLTLLTGVVWLLVRLCAALASRWLPLVGRRHLVPGARRPRDVVVTRDTDLR